MAMEGANESARVSAARVLLDALHVPEEQQKRNLQAEAGEARQHLEAAIARIVAAQPPEERPEWMKGEIERLQDENQQLRDELARVQELVA